MRGPCVWLKQRGPALTQPQLLEVAQERTPATAGSVSLPALSSGGGIWTDQTRGKEQASLGTPRLAARREKVLMLVF